jgi:hypothetical protein
MSLLSKLKNYTQSFYTFITSEIFLSYFSALPLFFSWLPTITWKYENKKLRDISLYSCIHFIGFISLIVIAVFMVNLPFIGGYLANLFHTIGILSYLGLSGFLIYLVATQKMIVIPIVSRYKDLLEEFIEGQSKTAPIAQLDRASDYGSEG